MYLLTSLRENFNDENYLHILIRGLIFFPHFDRPKINIVFSNAQKVKSCIVKQTYNSKTIL